jgi:2-C-methyl-D-erythritol 4-phosphate cytidylyltransferase
MGSDIPKQYLPLAGRSVIEHTLDTLFSCNRLAGVVLAVSADDSRWAEIRPRYADSMLQCVTGGAERGHSVLMALRHLAGHADPGDWVLVHDAARPCVRLADIETLIAALQKEADGGLLGVPVSDTMKRVDRDGRISATVEREALWHAQTPQMFRLGPLLAALEQALEEGVAVTDEASAMERAGYRPRMIEGHADNIKITVPAHLALAEFYLQERSRT